MIVFFNKYISLNLKRKVHYEELIVEEEKPKENDQEPKGINKDSKSLINI